mmetsp:Transcript_32415/g.100268  ORF Transcript_32415/g.100268 Transcript_32415/m.100268 type:complete len:215 (-) Transcript_32415:22-666(-)
MFEPRSKWPTPPRVFDGSPTRLSIFARSTWSFTKRPTRFLRSFSAALPSAMLIVSPPVRRSSSARERSFFFSADTLARCAAYLTFSFGRFPPMRSKARHDASLRSSMVMSSFTSAAVRAYTSLSSSLIFWWCTSSSRKSLRLRPVWVMKRSTCSLFSWWWMPRCSDFIPGMTLSRFACWRCALNCPGGMLGERGSLLWGVHDNSCFLLRRRNDQ